MDARFPSLPESYFIPPGEAAATMTAGCRLLNIDEALSGHIADTRDVCAVCLGDDGCDTTLLPCGHRFHGSCIIAWVEKNFSCPICRRVIEQFVPIVDGKVVQGFGDAPSEQEQAAHFGRFVAIWNRHYLNTGRQHIHSSQVLKEEDDGTLKKQSPTMKTEIEMPSRSETQNAGSCPTYLYELPRETLIINIPGSSKFAQTSIETNLARRRRKHKRSLSLSAIPKHLRTASPVPFRPPPVTALPTLKASVVAEGISPHLRSLRIRLRETPEPAHIPHASCGAHFLVPSFGCCSVYQEWVQGSLFMVDPRLRMPKCICSSDTATLSDTTISPEYLGTLPLALPSEVVARIVARQLFAQDGALLHLKAGAIAGVATSILVHLLDGSASRFLNTRAFSSGLAGGVALFRGVPGLLQSFAPKTLFGVAPSVAMFFTVYEAVKETMHTDTMPLGPVKLGSWSVAAATGAAAAHMRASPSPLVPLRYMIQFGIFEVGKEVISGMRPSDIRNLPLSPTEVAIAAAIGGVCASATVYPANRLHSLVSSRMNVCPLGAQSNWTSKVGAAVQVLSSNGGFRNLFQNWRSSLTRFVPSCVVTAVAYEMSLRHLRDESWPRF